MYDNMNGGFCLRDNTWNWHNSVGHISREACNLVRRRPAPCSAGPFYRVRLGAPGHCRSIYLG